MAGRLKKRETKIYYTPCRLAETQAPYKFPGRQLPLFKTTPLENGNGQASFRDPAFMENKNLPIHRWIPWIAGYSSSFIDDVISSFLPHHKKGLVLDPFCGVGTTLLQVVLRGYNAIGFEINPYPALAARAKLTAATINLTEFDEALRAIGRTAMKWQTASPPADISPPAFKSRLPFFSPKVEKQVLHALSSIKKIKSETIANLFRAAFGAIMVSISNYSYEPSLGSRPAAGKALIENADVKDVLFKKLLQMRADIVWLQAELKGRPLGSGRVIQADFFSGNHELEPGSVSLMVTSPPYMNNYHYVRNTRPQLYWLNFISSPAEQKYLEVNNFGQYWQTVRDAKPIDLTFTHAELLRILGQLRETRTEKGSYGGPGWANYVASYFNDCFRFMGAIKRVLPRGGVGVIVIGNSIIQGIDIRTERILGEIGEIQGLNLSGIFTIREKRVGASITQSSVRYGEQNKAVLSESAVVVHKR